MRSAYKIHIISMAIIKKLFDISLGLLDNDAFDHNGDFRAYYTTQLGLIYCEFIRIFPCGIMGQKGK